MSQTDGPIPCGFGGFDLTPRAPRFPKSSRTQRRDECFWSMNSDPKRLRAPTATHPRKVPSYSPSQTGAPYVRASDLDSEMQGLQRLFKFNFKWETCKSTKGNNVEPTDELYLKFCPEQHIRVIRWLQFIFILIKPFLLHHPSIPDVRAWPAHGNQTGTERLSAPSCMVNKQPGFLT